jgi:hypothetical protein
MTPKDDEAARRTFLAVRAGLIVMVAMLGGSVLLQIYGTDNGCSLTSISAYYYTPVRSMFVGMLCAMGISLLAYQGCTDTENVLLDYSGFLAFVVAFVPTGFEQRCSAEDVDTSAAVTNNVIPLLVAGFVVTVWACAKWLKDNGGSKPDENGKVALLVAWLVTLLLVISGTWLFFNEHQWFEDNAHGAAAYSLFGGIFLVVVVNTLRKAKKDYSLGHLVKIGYFWIAVVMAVTIAVFLAVYLGTDFEHAVFWVEASMISEFALFWSFQTHEITGAKPGNAEPGQDAAPPKQPAEVQH